MTMRSLALTFLAALRRTVLFMTVMAASAGAFADESPPTPRGLWGRTIIPESRPRETGSVDAAWTEVAALIQVTPALDVQSTPQKKSDWSGYVFWQEFSNRLLRETGLRFYARFPSDPRIWLWLEATLERQPLYLDISEGWLAQNDPATNPSIDQVARTTWEEKYPVLRAACIASPAAPDSLRLRMWCELLREPIQRGLSARLRRQAFDFGTINYEEIGRGLARMGETFPARDDIQLRVTTDTFFSYAAKYAPGVESKWRIALGQSPSRALRDLALARAQGESLRTAPLEMRFTAVDGREVDVAKLRGKVVLIDFWAATWCGACKVQEPLMKEVYAKYRAQGFEIIGIACEMKPSDREFLVNYVRSHEMPWPQFFEGNGMNNEYTLRYGFTSIPQFFLLGPDGLLVAHTSGSDGLRNLEAVVRKQLGLPPLQAGDEDKVLGVSEPVATN